MSVIRGQIAQIYWGDPRRRYLAAALHGFTLTHERKSRVVRLTATIVSLDAFRMQQSPLRLVWAQFDDLVIDSFSIDRGTIHAVLSQARSSDHEPIPIRAARNGPTAVE